MTFLEIINEHFKRNDVDNPIRYLATKLQCSDTTMYNKIRVADAGIGQAGGRLNLQDADWLIKVSNEVRTNPNGINPVKTFLEQKKREAGIRS